MTSTKPDVDVLYILDSDNDVSLTQKANGARSFTSENCPAGYGMVYQTDSGLCVNANNIRELSRTLPNGTCPHGCEFRFKEYHGPAVLFEIPQESYDVDITHGFACDEPFPEMDDFKHRTRSQYWHSTIDLDSIVELPGILVPTGLSRTHSDTDYLFRLSFCQQELILVSSTKEWMKRAALAFKYLIKSLKPHDNQEVSLDSYHCKTVFMWTLEEMDDSLWENGSPTDLLLRLFDTLIGFLEGGLIPNYWIPEQNLLATWDNKEITSCLELVKELHVYLLLVQLSLQAYDGRQNSPAQFCMEDKNMKSYPFLSYHSTLNLSQLFINARELLQVNTIKNSRNKSSTLQQQEQITVVEGLGVRECVEDDSFDRTDNRSEKPTHFLISHSDKCGSNEEIHVRPKSHKQNPLQYIQGCLKENLYEISNEENLLPSIIGYVAENLKPIIKLISNWNPTYMISQE